MSGILPGLITLSFHGAARTVTGSKHLLSVNGRKLLIDCGMFQGRRELRELNWKQPPFDPKAVDAVILTHAHIDHIGWLPRLVRCGFKGKVFASAPTCDLATLSLLDAAHIQEEDAEYRNRKKISRHKKALPLFTNRDANKAIKMLTPIPFDTWQTSGAEFKFRLRTAGHLLGAAGVEIDLNDGERKIKVYFSGDVGRYGNPLTRDPAEPPECDYLICESTYGDRIHPPSDPYFDFGKLLDRIITEKRILLIPAFAIGRTQQISFLVNQLIKLGRIQPIDIHVDSPMAITATDLFCKYSSYHAVDLHDLDGPDCVIAGKYVTLHRKRSESRRLNKLRGPAIIMSSSGMLTGGRIMHHLMNRLPDPKTTVALVGYMAEGTNGRKLQDGAKTLYIHKQAVSVKAEVINMSSLSGHADYYELMHWLEPIKKAPRKVFLTHGEERQARAMAERLGKERNWDCVVPSMNDSVELV